VPALGAFGARAGSARQYQQVKEIAASVREEQGGGWKKTANWDCLFDGQIVKFIDNPA